MSFFSKAKSLVSALLPPIIFPQKRYLLLFLGVVYFGANYYVKNTPDPEDDKILEQIHAIAVQVLAQNEKPEIVDLDAVQLSDKDQDYGEGY